MDDQAEPAVATTPETSPEPAQQTQGELRIEAKLVSDTYAVVWVKYESECLYVDRLDLTSATAREHFTDGLLVTGLRFSSFEVHRHLINLAEELYACTAGGSTSLIEEVPNICVVGVQPDGSTVLMARDSRRTISCQTARLSYIDLLELGGQGVADRFSEKDLSRIRQHIAIAARRQQLAAYRPIGRGIWYLGDGEEAMLISGANAFRWNGTEASAVDHPLCEDCHIHFDPGREWCDAENVVRRATAMDLCSARSIFDRLRDVLETYGFAGDVENDLAAALTIASVISDFLPVTPLVLVEASSPSEIDWVCQSIARLLGDLALAADACGRPARSKQLVRPDKIVPLWLLSSERKGPHSHLLDLDQGQAQVERPARKGGRNQNRSVQWLFATGSAFDPEYYQDNCIRLNLKSLREILMGGSNDDRLRPELPPLALWLSLRVQKIAAELADIPATLVDQRLNMLFAGPAAILAVLQHGDPSPQDALQHLSRLVAWHLESEQQQSQDACDLLKEILFSRVNVTGQEMRITDLLDDHDSESSVHALGIRRLRGGDVFLAHELISSNGSDPRELLQALPGARAGRRRIGPDRHRGIIVPKALVDDLVGPRE